MSPRMAIMQLTDTLDAGGKERVAVNLAAHLPRDKYELILCTTRHEGQLASEVAADVRRLCLNRQKRLDFKAILQLASFNKAHKVKILHAHGSTVFLSLVASFLPPYPKVIWHQHSGLYPVRARPVWLYKLTGQRANEVITVNQTLAEWTKQVLLVPEDRVWYIPNFVTFDEQEKPIPSLPGQPGARLVCVANQRPEKGLVELIGAMKMVVERFPLAHLLLVGADSDPAYANRVRQEINKLDLLNSVTLCGPRSDVPELLRGCDIGVLSSLSEGLPMALLEYGAAGLPVVCTRVGQCAEVLQWGQAGLLVEPGDPIALAHALVSLFDSELLRETFRMRFKSRVREDYSLNSVIELVCQVYDRVINE
jgi:glycosyltransferase involved in cell wall biosynthesis